MTVEIDQQLIALHHLVVNLNLLQKLATDNFIQLYPVDLGLLDKLFFIQKLMIRKQKNGLFWLEFNLLQPYPFLKHAVLSRQGGFSKEPFDSLNFSYDLDDNKEDVNKNFSMLKDTFLYKSIHYAKQVHKDTIRIVKSNTPKKLLDCDGLITKEKNKALLIKHADCQAAIFFDPIHHIVASVHSGWQGSVQNIYSKTIQKMKKKFTSNPRDILVCISPSLGPQSSEFINYKKELPRVFYPYQFKPYYFDFWEISKSQLIQAGIQKENIEIAQIDTVSTQDFFSYRRDKICGRNGTFVMLAGAFYEKKSLK